MVVLAIFSIQKQLKLRDENISLYDYKKYDFRYRKASGATPGTGISAKPKYEPIGEDPADNDA